MHFFDLLARPRSPQNSNPSRNLTWCRSKFARSSAPGALVVPPQIWEFHDADTKGVPAKSRVEGWTDVERLTCEDIQRGTAVAGSASPLQATRRARPALQERSLRPRGIRAGRRRMEAG